MRKWNHFEVGEPRSQTAFVYKADERHMLELAVAEQVSELLGNYGQVEEVDVNESGFVMSAKDITEFASFVSYNALSLEPLPLEDDSKIQVCQLPIYDDGRWETGPGVFSVEHISEDDIPMLNIIIHHPMHGIEPPVQDSAGNTVDLELLQELHELLGALTRGYIEAGVVNNPPHDTMQYPVLIDSEPITYGYRSELITAPFHPSSHYEMAYRQN